ncbi:3-phosphoshikimate 1-carboxyvinyltransferase [Candidatus Desantisbacteria bacterium]|nr:3-phosphoshikimate 1-carboxyvinyltransferase [Candidatus Desantisbacteria bacterium]
MNLIVTPSELNGNVVIPASKSHTIRAVVIASLADGISEIINPLNSSDTLSAVTVCQGLGARIELREKKGTEAQLDPHSIPLSLGEGERHKGTEGEEASPVDDLLTPDPRPLTPAFSWIVHGLSGKVMTPEDILDVGNSGTTLYLTLAMAALSDGYSVFTGDEQTRRRPAQPLIDSLNSLGAHVFSTRGNSCAPIVVKGRMRGGEITIDGSKTSQYISSLLIACPLADNDTKIRVVNVTEEPYIQMTMDWLNDQGIEYSHEGMEYFHIKGGQGYRHFIKRMPGDFSSATFFLCAGAIINSDITLIGLDMNDSQGDKVVVDMLSSMGAEINIESEGIRIKNKQLHGAKFDLKDTPDALPAMAVVGCFAQGVTRLVNVPQARFKETDRIKVMCQELSKMGANIRELPDGLEIAESELHGAIVHGHSDHRVVMALAVAGLAAKGKTTIDTAESMNITFPDFVELMQKIGGRIKFLPEGQNDQRGGGS